MQAWLGRLGLADLAPVFERNHITRETLSDLTNDDLKDCGISSVGHRKKLLAAIQELSAPGGPGTGIQPATEGVAASVQPAARHEPEPAPRPQPSRAPEAVHAPAPGPAVIRAKHPPLVPAPVTGGMTLAAELHLHQDAQQAALRRQQKLSLISSMIIALLSITLIMIILAMFVLPSLLIEAPQVVVYESSTTPDESLDAKKVSTQWESKPSRPASSMAQVIAADMASPTAVPVPDIAVTTPSIEFGDAEDFGEGWGEGDGDGSGSGISFFGMKKAPKAVVFVFDISGSMVVKPKSPKTYQVLEEEIVKSISMLPSDGKFGLVGFSKGAESYKSSLVTSILSERNGAATWLKSMSPIPAMRAGNNFQKYKGGRHSGTRADLGLEAAMRLRPDTIIFVSDGEPTDQKGKSSRAYEKEVLKKVAAMQKNQPRKVQINAVAYMAGGGLNFMRELAKQNDGDFREIRPKDIK
jgi:hypothetical protein